MNYYQSGLRIWRISLSNSLGFDKEQENQLIICENSYALFVAITMRLSEIIPANTDIIFTDTFDFTQVADSLRGLQLFRDIWMVQTRRLVTKTKSKPHEEREHISKHPEKFMPIPFGNNNYTHLWLSRDSLCSKYYYYSLVNLGSTPKIRFFEEGNTSYCLDLSTLSQDYIPHDGFGKLSFAKACQDIWLFEPEEFQPIKVPFECKPIPKTLLRDSKFQETIMLLFGNGELPHKHFVFLEQCFNEDGGVTDDLEIVKYIAQVVGKESIEIRLHPRTKVNRFEPFGYTTSTGEGALWETQLMQHLDQIKDLVLITVDSTAAFSSYKLMNVPMDVIILDRLIWGSYKDKNSKSKMQYFSTMVDRCNRDKTHCFRPYSYPELKIDLEYLMRKI